MTTLNSHTYCWWSSVIVGGNVLREKQGLCSTRICQVSNNSNNIKTKPTKCNQKTTLNIILGPIYMNLDIGLSNLFIKYANIDRIECCPGRFLLHNPWRKIKQRSCWGMNITGWRAIMRGAVGLLEVNLEIITGKVFFIFFTNNLNDTTLFRLTPPRPSN